MDEYLPSWLDDAFLEDNVSKMVVLAGLRVGEYRRSPVMEGETFQHPGTSVVGGLLIDDCLKFDNGPG